jgi:hypothetical protein
MSQINQNANILRVQVFQRGRVGGRREGFALKFGGGPKVNGAIVDNINDSTGCDNTLRNQLLSTYLMSQSALHTPHFDKLLRNIAL